MKLILFLRGKKALKNLDIKYEEKKMNIAILGAGNAGCAVAADLSLKGHQVTLIKTSRSIHNDNYLYIKNHSNQIKICENDNIREAKIYDVSFDLSKIIDNEIIIIYTQTSYHEQLIKKISKYIQDGQIIIINPGYLSTAFILKYCNGKDISIVEATSSFIDCRISDPGMVNVGFRNVRNPVGVYPHCNTDKVKQKLECLGFNLHYYSTVEVALHNPNLIVHTVGAIMSIPRIEKMKEEYCMYWEVWTPSVWNILEALDAEKMDILENLGFERLAYVDACKFRNTLDDVRDGKEIFMWYANMPTRAKGPSKVDSRYISEDVPQGLVMLEALGKWMGINTPVCTALIEIATAALQRDLRLEGRCIEVLGEDNLAAIIKDSKYEKTVN